MHWNWTWEKTIRSAWTRGAVRWRLFYKKLILFTYKQPSCYLNCLWNTYFSRNRLNNEINVILWKIKDCVTCLKMQNISLLPTYMQYISRGVFLDVFTMWTQVVWVLTGKACNSYKRLVPEFFDLHQFPSNNFNCLLHCELQNAADRGMWFPSFACGLHCSLHAMG
jgi:hypothetical protein